MNGRLQDHQRAFTSRPFKKSVRSLTTIIRSRLRAIINRKRRLPTVQDQLRFMLPLKHHLKKQKFKSHFLEDDELLCLKVLFQELDCLCSVGRPNNGRRKGHSKLCNRIMSSGIPNFSIVTVRRFLSEIFSFELEVRQESQSDDDTNYESETTEEDVPGDEVVYNPDGMGAVSSRTR